MPVSNTREAVVTSRGFDWGIAVEDARGRNKCRSRSSDRKGIYLVDVIVYVQVTAFVI